MGLQYLTPTIGLYIKPEDFIKFVSNLKYYISLTPVGLKEQPSNLPNKQDNHLFIARLGDITLNFIHYKSLEDGIAKWERRKKRICWNNIIVKMANPIFTNKVIQEEKLEEFSHISYKKLLFTAEKDVACRFNYAYLFDGNGEKRINDEFRDADKVVGMKKMKQIINS